MVRPLHMPTAMMAGAQLHASEQTAVARQMLVFWDQSWSKNLAASFLAFFWFGAFGHSLLPLGLILALHLMLPEIPGWSLWRRLRFAGRRTVTLVALATVAFFFAHLEIGVLPPEGGIAYVRPRFLVPTALGWLAADRKDAISSHRQACTSGIADACAALGRYHLEGRGVEQDPRAAASYFEAACEQGHSLSCVSLGRMYSRGTGVEADRTTAKLLYVEACRRGELVGCHNQGALQLSEGNHASGMDVLMRACSNDFGRSCFLVGEQYRLGGGGLRKSPRRAEVWLEKACRLHVKEACALIEKDALSRREG